MEIALHIASMIGERATLVIIVAIAVLAISGLPKSKTRYRTLAIALTVLSLFAACQWYITFVIGSYYAKTTQWGCLVPMFVFAIAFFFGLVESVSLRWFKRRAVATKQSA